MVCGLLLPADKVADDVGMADEDLVAVLLLSGRSSMEVPTESCLNSGPFLEKLLTHTHTARPHTQTDIIVLHYRDEGR